MRINEILPEQQFGADTKTLTPAELQVKSLKNKSKQFNQQAKQVKAQQQVAKAQQKLAKVSSAASTT